MSVKVETAGSVPLVSEEEFEERRDEDTRAEFVDGRVIRMSAVAVLHLKLGGFLFRLVGGFLEARPAGELFPAELEVRLRPGLRRGPAMTYVSPENLARVREKRIEGAPDAVWEIVSPESRARDYREKYQDYETAGVREYWLVDPYPMTVALYRLGKDGKYHEVPEQEGRLVSDVISGFWLKPEWLRLPLPRVTACLQELGVISETGTSS